MINDRPTYLKVRLDRILDNYNNIKEKLNNKEIMAVVKADAYGHGAKTVVNYLYNNGAKYFAVTTLEEALEIRKIVKKGMILVLGVTNPKNIEYAIKNEISLCCPSAYWLKSVVKNLKNITGTLKIHLKVDSGMSRIGIVSEEEAQEVNTLIKNSNIELEGIFTHYSNSDDKDNFYDIYQRKNFEKIVKFIDVKPKYIHHENTAATMRYYNNDFNFNIARVGISLYGSYPSYEIKKMTDIKIKNVSSLISKVVHIKKIKSNTKVGYGCTYESKVSEYLATVPIGYRDGLLRFAQGYKVKINGVLCEIVGRVCMDQIMIKCPEKVFIGDNVLFYGEFGTDYLSVENYAEHIKTIPYEIYCILGERVPRRYYVGDKEVEKI